MARPHRRLAALSCDKCSCISPTPLDHRRHTCDPSAKSPMGQSHVIATAIRPGFLLPRHQTPPPRSPALRTPEPTTLATDSRAGSAVPLVIHSPCDQSSESDYSNSSSRSVSPAAVPRTPLRSSLISCMSPDEAAWSPFGSRAAQQTDQALAALLALTSPVFALQSHTDVPPSRSSMPSRPARGSA